jgi:hypothetical protein
MASMSERVWHDALEQRLLDPTRASSVEGVVDKS